MYIPITIPDGYTYAGVLSVVHPYSNIVLSAYGVLDNNNNIQLMFRNVTQSGNITISVDVLFIKSILKNGTNLTVEDT